MNEMLCGIRVLKFYAWEDHFTSRIQDLRSAELKSLKGRKYLDALCVYFWATTPVLISILTFTTYALLGHKLTAAKVTNLIIAAVCNIDFTSNKDLENLKRENVSLDCELNQNLIFPQLQFTFEFSTCRF